MEKRRMDNPKTVIYYNPKCSKCRMTLKLLHDQGKQPRVIEYLQAVPTRSDIESILAQLGVTAGQLLRKHEPAYREAGLDESSSDEEILDAMAQYPILIERPIVVHDGKAVIARPPENVLGVL